MSLESHEHIIQLEGEHLREKNLLQIEVAHRICGPDADDTLLGDWLAEHSFALRQLIEAELGSDPAFFEGLADPARHEEILERFAGAMHGAEDMKKAA